MKRLPLVALSVCIAFSSLALAQQSPAGPDGNPPAGGQHMHQFDAQSQLQRLTKVLQLTPDQQAKIGPMLQQREQQMQALRSDTSSQPADRRAKVMAIMRDSEAQIGGVLTQEQRDKWKAMREKAMEHMQERRGQGVPSSPEGGNGG